MNAGIASGDTGNLHPMTQYWASETILEAFAFELYLKCQLKIENSERILRGHDLAVLFGQLSSATRIKVRSVYDRPTPRAAFMRKAFQEKMGEVLDFDEELKLSKDAFTNFRYFFERGNFSNLNYHSSEIVEALREVIINENPSFRAYVVGPGR